MSDPKKFADHMSRVLAGILVHVAEGVQLLPYESVEQIEGRFNAIGTDVGLALQQAIAHRKEMTP